MKPITHITVICWYKVFPAVSGGQNGIANFVKALAQLFPLNFICSRNNSPTETYLQPTLPTSKWQLLSWGTYKHILQSIKNNKSSHVIIEHPYYALLALYQKKYNFQLIIHTHNIEYLRVKQLGKYSYPLMYLLEKFAYNKAAFIWCKTDDDAQVLQTHFGVSHHKIKILPYCTTYTQYPTSKPYSKQLICNTHLLNPNQPLFLFAASFNYKPNQLALLHLLKNVYPLLLLQIPQPFTVLLCGWELTHYIKKNNLQLPSNCISVGEVTDVVSYIQAADVVLNPVAIGQGIQTKSIDAIANNTNVVTYCNMINGIPKYEYNNKVFVASQNNVADFVTQLKAALKATNNNTSPHFYNTYNWTNAIQRCVE